MPVIVGRIAPQVVAPAFEWIDLVVVDSDQLIGAPNDPNSIRSAASESDKVWSFTANNVAVAAGLDRFYCELENVTAFAGDAATTAVIQRGRVYIGPAIEEP